MSEPRSKSFKMGAIGLFLVAAGALTYVLMGSKDPEGQGFVAEDPAKVEALKQQPEGMRAREASPEAIKEAVRSDDPEYLNAPKADGGEVEVPKTVTQSIKRIPKPKKPEKGN